MSNPAVTSTPDSASHAPWRADIDGLRALAVTSVVFFHAFPGALPGGFTGVDVFFVISGFLIGGILIDTHVESRFTYRDFYARRVRRLFPALATVLLAVLVAGFFLLTPGEYRAIGKHVLAGAGFASNLALQKEAGYFDTESSLKPLLHLWSLGVEEQFYILCPLVVALGWRLRRYLPWLMPWLFCALAVASFFDGLHWLDVRPAKAFFHPLERFWELFAGVALASFQRSAVTSAVSMKFATSLREIAAATGMLLMLSGFVLINEKHGFPGMWALLPVLGAVLVLGPASGSRITRVLLANRPMVFVGLISYPLYLWHWPLLSFARVVTGDEPAAPLRLALVALAFLLAWITWRRIEIPLRQSAPGVPTVRRLAIAMVVIALVGLAVQKTDGLALRYPPDVRIAATYHYNGKGEGRVGECFLETEQTAQDFAPDCVVTSPDANAPRLLLWGDSHASALYTGMEYEARQSPSFTLWQFTASGCPPVPGLTMEARPACRAINDFVLERIRILRPDAVVLSAFWLQYQGGGGWSAVDPAQLRALVDTLHQAGVKHVAIVGQVPVWSESLPVHIVKLFDRHGAVPGFTSEGLVLPVFETETRYRAALAGSDAVYVSPLERFCRDGECRTFSDDNRSEPEAFDYGHLSPSSARIVAKDVRKALAL